MKISFFDFAAEVRLKIYAELVVALEPIGFVADYGPPSPPLFRSRKDRLYPAVLRVCRQFYDEAIPLTSLPSCRASPNAEPKHRVSF